MPRRRKTAGKRRQRGGAVNNMNFYTVHNVGESEASDLGIRSFAPMPIGMPFRITGLSWQLGLGGVATTSSGNIVHRSGCAQLGLYGPGSQLAEHLVWSSGPILVPWGSRITGQRRVRGLWFDSQAPQTTKLARVECICLQKDTTNVQIEFVLKIHIQFGQPDFGPECPALMSYRGQDDYDDEQSTSSFAMD